eukprot:scaffold35915_cov69-Phaeocystis_antarctica.AAC.4
MQRPKLTVSREQCKVIVAADGTAALVSCGKGPTWLGVRVRVRGRVRGPTLWRQSGAPWYAMSRSETCTLADGDQISLDCNDPEAAVFTCEVNSAAQQTYTQQYYAQSCAHRYAQSYAQQGYTQQGYAQQGYAQGDLRMVVGPPSWSAAASASASSSSSSATAAPAVWAAGGGHTDVGVGSGGDAPNAVGPRGGKRKLNGVGL